MDRKGATGGEERTFQSGELGKEKKKHTIRKNILSSVDVGKRSLQPQRGQRANLLLTLLNKQDEL